MKQTQAYNTNVIVHLQMPRLFGLFFTVRFAIVVGDGGGVVIVVIAIVIIVTFAWLPSSSLASHGTAVYWTTPEPLIRIVPPVYYTFNNIYSPNLFIIQIPDF